ncbi:hypothetical protein DQ237_15745 [Blastococcus sp. TF02-8]|uniref:hypothetical protein n=1 Tax=Blastococcus sp. TF02-8 TaxID=2250574 RepID=UPI000DEBA5BB|nr:hypothetical protein [Blastococcus sp. TF02-8]RBY95145.1 hypothetical protein DQ237_15745 [Blastococcus sp. TF02-8]
MDVVLGLLAMLVPVGALAVVALPPILLLGRRGPIASSLLLYLASLALLAAWGVAWLADMDRADRTGDAGSMFAGGGWLLLAVAAATASVVVSLRHARRAPAVPGRD